MNRFERQIADALEAVRKVRRTQGYRSAQEEEIRQARIIGLDYPEAGLPQLENLESIGLGSSNFDYDDKDSGPRKPWAPLSLGKKRNKRHMIPIAQRTTRRGD